MHRYSVAAQLRSVLEPLQDQIPHWHCPVVPSTANANDESLCALPLPKDWRWRSLAEHLQRWSVETLILQLPLFWQVEPFVHAAARTVGAPLCIIDPGNYPLDKAALRFVSTNAIVAEPTEAGAIAEYLGTQAAALPPYWVVVHQVDALKWMLPPVLMQRGLQVAAEVHLAPGVPLLVQCSHSVDAKNNFFHYSNLFNWSDDLHTPVITQKEPMLVNFGTITLPFSLEDKGVCQCGKRLVARLA